MNPRWKPIPRVRPFANPAAGAVFTFSPDHSAGVLICSLRFQLTTDANAATRELSITVSDGSAEWFRTSEMTGQTASQTREYSAFDGSQGGTSVLPVRLIDWPNVGVWVPPGNTFTIGMEGIQVGDQLANIAAYMIEFPTGPGIMLWPFPPYYTEESE